MSKKRWGCHYCNKDFASKQGRSKHLQNHCKGRVVPVEEGKQAKTDLMVIGEPSEVLEILEVSEASESTNLSMVFQRFREEIKKDMTAVVDARLEKQGVQGVQGVQEVQDKEKESKIDIVCLAKGDYIKKLIQLHDGDEEKAMSYIKNIGIATDFLEGDFRMIKKVYFDGKKKSQFPIRIKDFKRNKLEYLEENGEWILDIRGEIVGKRLCDNLVSTLLIANTQFNELIIQEKDEDRKELLLDLFQINKTQAHIMKLLERKTQGKLSRRVAEFINYCTEVHAETGSLDNVKKAYD